MDKFNDDKTKEEREQTENTEEEEQVNEPNVSPVSSLASNRKLEWDSGADIGYVLTDSLKGNQKCKSYPILNIDLSAISNVTKSDKKQPDSTSPKLQHSTPLERNRSDVKTKVDECLQTSLVRKCSKSVQTDANTRNSNPNSNSNSNSTSDTSCSSSASKSSSFKYIPGSKPGSVSTTNSSHDSHLGKMIATQQSHHLITDIDKSLRLLQQFLLSKNYNSATKKHYARKVVNKILRTKYDSDTSKTSSSVVSDSDPEIKSDVNKELIDHSVQCDVKSYASCGVQCDSYNEMNSDRNWRDSKTLSEKLFDAKQKYSNHRIPKQSDSSNSDREFLLQHTKKEKRRQLSWINNEMIYLRKLQELLESKDFSSFSSDSSNKVSKTKSSTSESEMKSGNSIKISKSNSTPEVNEIKLSQFLTNEQIKYLIKNNKDKCLCCKHVDKTEEEKKPNDNSTFNSHIHRKMISPKPVTIEASIQCELSSKSSSNSTRIISPVESSKSVNLLYENIKKCVQPEASIENIDSDKENEKSTENSLISTNQGKAVAYFLTFEETFSENFQSVPIRKPLKKVTVKVPKLNSKRDNKKKDKNEGYSSLQEYLNNNRPNFLKAAEWRRTCINKTEPKNIFTCQELKEITSKQYNKLPEVQSKLNYNKMQTQRRNNRHMANVFSKKLQSKALQGQISLSTCVSVMSS